MTSDLTTYESPDDDGFHHSFGSGGRTAKGSMLRWNAERGWLDRDGLPPPAELLVVAVNEVLQRWQDNRPETISAKPLPDPDELNAAIPRKEWELGLDGNPRKPWEHYVVVYLLDPAAGGFFTFVSPTIGAHIAFDFLKEAVMSMRMLRGVKVLPLVNLGERPMKTKFGQKSRPHFEIVGWKTPGDHGPAALPETAPPAALEPAPPETPPPAAKPRAKLQVNLATGLSDVKPVTIKEVIDDNIPW